MKIATYNINNVGRRLPNLLSWLKRAKPGIVCLQELKAADEAFPEATLRDAGYGAVWRGQKTRNGVAILARKATPVLTRKALPGGRDDTQSRYIEAAVEGMVVGCLYLPNGNPQPGPKFTYKLDWFRRLQDHAKTLLESGAPVVLAGDYNAVPTDFDIYAMRSWKDDALVQPQTRAAYAKLVGQGWTDSLRTLFPGQAHVHLLGLQTPALGTRRRAAAGSSAAIPIAQRTPAQGRRRSRRTRQGRCQRPRTGLDRPALTAHRSSSGDSFSMPDTLLPP